ncbi:MAG: hypothetical protein F6K19_03105 [Cyanothece sp. SIO1E1]|nr:hypothetical protein [Cyanothece sp. SIO1E1]
MKDKQKVTLYIPPELHRKLKIRAAVDAEPMSAMAERALSFYLEHPEVVEGERAGYGATHQVYGCPECSNSVVIRNGRLVSLSNQAGLLDDEVPVGAVQSVGSDHEGEEELVPC